MADLKISQFVDGGAIQPTDEIATNRGGINTKVFVGSAAALDAGSGVGDVITWQDDGSGNPQYRAGDGSQIVNVPLPTINAQDVVYTPESGTIITAINVQDAITELDELSQSKLDNITGLITAESGSDITISGSGTSDDPYVLDYTGSGGNFLLKDEPVVTANISGTYDINFNAGQVWDLTATGDCDIDIINPPSMGGSIPVKIVQDSTPRTIDFVISGLTWANGAVPIMPPTGGDYIWVLFVTDDGGTTWTGFDCGLVEP